MNWQQWVQLNYAWLSQYASIYSDLSGDLLTHLCLYFEDGHWHKFNQMPEPDKRKWVRAFFRNQVKWSNSPVSRENKTNSLTQEQIDWFENAYDTPDNSHIEIEVGAEDTNQDIKEWITDCQLQFGETKTEKLLQIRLIFRKYLNLPEQILYGLYFEELLTHRQIAQRLKIPLTSSFFMVKKLENKLIELCNGTQSSL